MTKYLGRTCYCCMEVIESYEFFKVDNNFEKSLGLKSTQFSVLIYICRKNGKYDSKGDRKYHL